MWHIVSTTLPSWELPSDISGPEDSLCYIIYFLKIITGITGSLEDKTLNVICIKEIDITKVQTFVLLLWTSVLLYAYIVCISNFWKRQDTEAHKYKLISSGCQVITAKPHAFLHSQPKHGETIGFLLLLCIQVHCHAVLANSKIELRHN